ncbi:hypothetical protein B0H17DRAFT_511304 [Mycena rosella]|uniref:Uncharacterized protein n=1 Tax=Mycena rosella TaxID=1033263 RepID=A0AAD7BXY1_MYCRO|nr:hypothetical protein B0H17DRAFT_511304 [Mycena rosella]
MVPSPDTGGVGGGVVLPVLRSRRRVYARQNHLGECFRSPPSVSFPSLRSSLALVTSSSSLTALPFHFMFACLSPLLTCTFPTIFITYLRPQSLTAADHRTDDLATLPPLADRRRRARLPRVGRSAAPLPTPDIEDERIPLRIKHALVPHTTIQHKPLRRSTVRRLRARARTAIARFNAPPRALHFARHRPIYLIRGAWPRFSDKIDRNFLGVLVFVSSCPCSRGLVWHTNIRGPPLIFHSVPLNLPRPPSSERSSSSRTPTTFHIVSSKTSAALAILGRDLVRE